MIRQKLRKYELIYLVQPEATDEEREKIAERVDLAFEKFENARVLRKEDWGKRKLAYEIRKFNKAFYQYQVFVGPPGLTAEIERVIESIPNLFRNPIRLEGGESVQMTGSVGVARAPEDVMNAQDLLKAADMALYEAKRRGRNQVVSYSAALRHKVNAMTHTIDVASRPARPLVGEFICGQPGRLFAIDRRKGDNLRPLTARLSSTTVDRSPSNEDPAVSEKPKLQDTA